MRGLRMGDFFGSFEPDPDLYDLCECGNYKRRSARRCRVCHSRAVLTESQAPTPADIAARRLREEIFDAALASGRYSLRELMRLARQGRLPRIEDL